MANCSAKFNKNGHSYIVLELGLMSVPAIVFILAATIRLCLIKHIGFKYGRITKILISKVATTITVGLVYLCLIPVNYFQTPDLLFSTIMNQCDEDNLSLLFSIQITAWWLCAYLIYQEFTRKVP